MINQDGPRYRNVRYAPLATRSLNRHFQQTGASFQPWRWKWQWWHSVEHLVESRACTPLSWMIPPQYEYNLEKGIRTQWITSRLVKQPMRRRQVIYRPRNFARSVHGSVHLVLVWGPRTTGARPTGDMTSITVIVRVWTISNMTVNASIVRWDAGTSWLICLLAKRPLAIVWPLVWYLGQELVRYFWERS